MEEVTRRRRRTELSPKVGWFSVAKGGYRH